jgi:hypothetical protein
MGGGKIGDVQRNGFCCSVNRSSIALHNRAFGNIVVSERLAFEHVFDPEGVAPLDVI